MRRVIGARRCHGRGPGFFNVRDRTEAILIAEVNVPHCKNLLNRGAPLVCCTAVLPVPPLLSGRFPWLISCLSTHAGGTAVDTGTSSWTTASSTKMPSHWSRRPSKQTTRVRFMASLCPLEAGGRAQFYHTASDLATAADYDTAYKKYKRAVETFLTGTKCNFAFVLPALEGRRTWLSFRSQSKKTLRGRR